MKRIALSMTSRRAPRAGAQAFTLLELLVAIAIVAMLAALLVTSVRSAMESSRRTACMLVLRNLGSAVVLYAADHRHRLPELEWFEQYRHLELLYPYLGDHSAFHCPGATTENYGLEWPEFYATEINGSLQYTDYKLNDNINHVAGHPIASIRHPAWVVLAIDIDWGPFRHGTGENMVFLDGRVQWLSREDAQGLDPYGNEYWYNWGTQ
jgi:prepilin-type N-terminal cleavage/methylation domain-containing protein